jgi:tRNA(Ile)-lysidine synthetase-like protein
MYSAFAKEFDHSRFSVWKCVQTFLSSIKNPSEKKLLDAGCGNGKNMVYANNLGFQTIGFDVCPELVSICQSKSLNVYLSDIQTEINEKYDVIICIAVIHHFESELERKKILKNLYNALNPDGKLLITTWSFELFDYDGKVFEKHGDNIVPWKGKGDRYYYIYNETNFKQLINSLEIEDMKDCIKISWEKQNWICEISKPCDLFGTSKLIQTFWRNNKQFWISIKNQTEADKIITEMFYDYDYKKENAIGQIIYLDQFSRHFQRFKHLDKDISNQRLKACLISSIIKENLYEEDEMNVYFALMPYKHLEFYDLLFIFLEEYIQKQKVIKGNVELTIIDFPILHKFFMDTYKKAYSFEKIYSDIQTIHKIGMFEFDKSTICDYIPDEYMKEDWNKKYISNKLNLELFESFGKELKKNSCIGKVVISLSGGVDSMVMCALCKIFNIECIAVHIVYGNRKESKEEYAFLVEYCKKLDIPFYSYKIEYLKRADVEREFYEKMTRDIRFNVYKAVGGNDCLVYLGHIKDDLVENVWTNFAKGVHLDNLKMMKQIEYMQDVYICRPFLNKEKKEIYEVSSSLFIPYLKNTTPLWSNRGKFRTDFYKATHSQYGESVDEKVLYVADVLSEQTKLIHKLLYEPILSSYDEELRTFDISRAIEAKIDVQSYNYLFEQICHSILGISKPSIHSIKDLHKRINQMISNKTEKSCLKIKVILKSDLTIFIQKEKSNKFTMIIE